MTEMTAYFGKSGSKSRLNREIIVPIAVQYFITYIIVQSCSTWRFNPDDDRWQYNLLSKGFYYDFNSNWFQDVGQSIYEIMRFNMIMPIIRFLTNWAYRYAMRIWDQRNSYNIPKFCPGSYKNTRCKSVQQFIDIYSGPQFTIHEKYTYIILVCAITMVFAPVMPILIVMCMVSLLILYLVERLAMAYAYQKPPMYSQETNVFLLRILALIPLVSYAPMSLWAFSNQQVFRDHVSPIRDSNLYSKPDHTYSQFFEQLTPATIWLFATIFSTAYWMLCRSGLNLHRFFPCYDY